MNLPITKSARQFGYVIWSLKNEQEMKRLLSDRSEVFVTFNGLNVGLRTIDWKYRRISIGYKFTRALPDTATFFYITMKDNVLELLATDVNR